MPAPDQAATHTEVIAALRRVYDPELPVNLYDLGLIYDIVLQSENDGFTVIIRMTLTAPACPVAGEMPGKVAAEVEKVAGVTRADVTLVWDPPWDKSRMSEDARLELNMF